MPRVPPEMTRRARESRNDPTPEEWRIWVRIRHADPRFTRQLRVGRYILDFVCRRLKLGIEIDGSQHAGSSCDAERTAFLEGLGWKVVRYRNSDVREDPDAVAEAVLIEHHALRGPTHPQPLPCQGGE